MNASKPSNLKKFCLIIPLGIFAFILLIAIAILISNVNLPQRSSTIDYLSGVEKARLSEALHLRNALGGAAWPGWSETNIPLIVYNEKYAFLVGYPNPPAGWLKVPVMEQRGGAWEVVPGDLFEDHSYYRTAITDPEKTPEGFTVLVGDQWVASFQTREYGQISFYRGFRQDLPPLISNLIPVRLVWAFLMGKTENYIAALEHEAFHAYEGIAYPSRLTDAESMYDVEAGYPYDQMNEAWLQEMDVLVRAVQAKTDAEAIDLARQFLQMRIARRSGLSSDQVSLERLREWEEGLAKYAELEITRLALSRDDYEPVASLSQDKDFHYYQDRQTFWSSQLKEAKNPNIQGDTRFYYSGNALAVLLDRLSPGWKPRALPGGEYLDDLLQAAVK